MAIPGSFPDDGFRPNPRSNMGTDSDFLDVLLDKAGKLFDKGLEIGESFFEQRQLKNLLSFQADLAKQGFGAPGLSQATGGVQPQSSSLGNLMPILLVGGVAVGAFLILRR